MEEIAKAWEHEIDLLHERLAGLFRRAEPRQRSLAYLKGLLGTVERKNGWQLAEWIGEATPDGVQHLLERAQWDPDAARNVLRDYVVEELGERDAVLIVDETGFLKKGGYSAGVQRQYSGTAGRIENSQIGVFLCYAGNGGSAFIDRELYMPQGWIDDRSRSRCRAAGVPDTVEFATKPQLARRMLERTLDAGVPCGCVTGDEVYGGDRPLRLWLESRTQSFVLAVKKSEPLWWQGPISIRADRIAQALPPQAWRRLSAGIGAKGERLYDWALTPLWRLQLSAEERRFGHYLLVRRSRDETREHAYYVVYAPRSKVTGQTLVNVAGRRWEIEVGLRRPRANAALTNTRFVAGRAGINRTPVREQVISFSTAVVRNETNFVYNRTDPKVPKQIRSVADIDKPGLVIAVVQGTTDDKAISPALKQAQILRLPDADSTRLALISHRANFLADQSDANLIFQAAHPDWAEIYHVQPPFNLQDVSFGLNKTYTDADLKVLNQFIEQQTKSGSIKTSVDAAVKQAAQSVNQ